MLTDEPVRGVFAYLEHPGILALSGIEQMRWFQRKDLPYGPLWYLTGAEPVESGPGMSTWRMPVTPWLQTPAGTLTGGVLALASDAALGSALYTTLPPGAWVTTSEASLHFLRPPASDCGALITRARLIQAGRSQGLTEASIEDADGHLLAHATTRNLITKLPVEVAEAPPALPIPWPDYEGPQPFQRPADGALIPQDVFDTMSGLEMMRAWVNGDLPLAPLTHFIGCRDIQFGEGTWATTISASPWWTTAGGTFYGGALAMFVDYAMHGAIHTTLPPGTSWGSLDLKVNFIRPVPPDGSELGVRGTILHRGRTLAVASGEIIGAGGKTIALANGSAMLLPGRPWRPGSPAAPIDEEQPGR